MMQSHHLKEHNMASNFLDQQTRIHLEDLEKMYGLLVWLGKLKNTEWDDPVIIKKVGYIVDNFPDHARNLALPEINQFYFGFYSGNLANIRYVLAMHYEGTEIADSEYPDLEVYA